MKNDDDHNSVVDARAAFAAIGGPPAEPPPYFTGELLSVWTAVMDKQPPMLRKQNLRFPYELAALLIHQQHQDPEQFKYFKPTFIAFLAAGLEMSPEELNEALKREQP